MDQVIHLRDVRPEVKGRVGIDGGGLAKLLSFTVRRNGQSDVYKQIVVEGVGDAVEIPFDPTSYTGRVSIQEYFERLEGNPTPDNVYRIKGEVDDCGADEDFFD